MAESTPSTPFNAPSAILSHSLILRLTSLRRRKRIIDSAIRRLVAQAAIVPRSQCDCLRCAFTWTPYNPYLPPSQCPRCGSHTWNEPWREGLRQPSDPPSPSWRTRKGTRRRPKLRIMDGPRRKRRSKEEMEADRAAQMTQTVGGMLHVSAPVPPRIAALLPPPPSISPLSLSARFAELREQQGEPQPEQVSSHLPSPPPPSEDDDERRAQVRGEGDFTRILDVTFDTLRKHEQAEEIVEQGTDIEREEAAEMPSAPAPSQPEPPAPVPPEPEYRENAFTERELAELDAAEEEVAWPTTKPD